MHISHKPPKVYENIKSPKANLCSIKLEIFPALQAVIFLFVFIGCGGFKEREIPETKVIGIKTTISRILISPLAFDGALVAVEGKAGSVELTAEPGSRTTITFKLLDPNGNFINVSAKNGQGVLQNDLLAVGGIYSRERNEIQAEQIEKIELDE